MDSSVPWNPPQAHGILPAQAEQLQELHAFTRSDEEGE